MNLLKGFSTLVLSIKKQFLKEAVELYLSQGTILPLLLKTVSLWKAPVSKNLLINSSSDWSKVFLTLSRLASMHRLPPERKSLITLDVQMLWQGHSINTLDFTPINSPSQPMNL